MGSTDGDNEARFQLLWRGREDALPLGVRAASVHVDRVSGLRVAVLRVPGPLCSATVVVPTEPECGDCRGLPHCLEHLVFLGTRDEPRGFLDTFAVRCLTPGTNAFTAEDHTEYTVTGAGATGVCRLLPHFLRHIFAPELTLEGLLTEVHHYDRAHGASSGVVFSEIAGRENSRADLCEAAVHRLAFPRSGYAAYCGGRTEGIARVTQQDVAAFHQRFYAPAEATLLVVANCDEGGVLAAAASAFPEHEGWEERAVLASGAWEQPLVPLKEDASELVRFPAEDDDDEFGSVVLAWRGPEFDDCETLAALGVLARFLTETAASPLVARFTQTVPPLASDADIAVVPFKEALIELSLDGVPHYWTPPPQATDAKQQDKSKSKNKNKNKSKSKNKNKNKSKSKQVDLFKLGAVKGLVLDFFKELTSRGYLGEAPETMREMARRHYIKFMEDMEDAPHNMLNELLVPLFAFRRRQLTPADLESRLCSSAAILRALADKPPHYWVELLERWVLHAPCAEVVMVPDHKVADTIAKNNAKRTKEAAARAAATQDYDSAVARALEKPGAALSDEARARVAEVPPISTVTAHDCETLFVLPSAACDAAATAAATAAAGCGDGCIRACAPTQVMSMRETQFAQVRVCVDMRALAPELKPYLPLFQDLFLMSPVRTRDGVLVDHFDAVRQMTRDLVTACAQFGFGATGFATGYLMDMFHVWLVAELDKSDRLCQWTDHLIRGLVFTAQSVLTETNNLLAILADSSRDSANVCDAATALVVAQAAAAAAQAKQQLPVAVTSNLLLQKKVLTDASKHPDAAVAALSAIRQFVHRAFCDPSRCFVQVFAPTGKAAALAGSFWDHWRADFAAAPADSAAASAAAAAPCACFARPDFVALAEAVPAGDVCTLVPVGGGCESATLRQVVVCRVRKQDPDYFALLVLCEVLSRSEGPLFTRIRGPGYAYDASLSFALWDGLLCLSLYECSAPDKALAEFAALLRDAARDFGALATPFVVDTARSALLYDFYSDRASVPLLSSAALCSPFKGFPRLADEDAFEQRLADVDVAAVERVFRRYCAQFLVPEQRTTVLAAQPCDVPRLRAVLAAPPFRFAVRVAKAADFAHAFQASTTTTTTPRSGDKKKKKNKKKKKSK